jgi:hypothetical protein
MFGAGYKRMVRIRQNRVYLLYEANGGLGGISGSAGGFSVGRGRVDAIDLWNRKE